VAVITPTKIQRKRILKSSKAEIPYGKHLQEDERIFYPIFFFGFKRKRKVKLEEVNASSF